MTKEKRILISEVNPDCKALYVDYGDPLDPDGGMFCDKSGRYVRITEKDCAKCKSPVLAGITRAEAIERAAKGIHYYEWGHHNKMPKWNELNSDIQNDYRKMAEAALDALLGKEAENDK